MEFLGGKDPVAVGGVVHSDDVEPLLVGGDGVVPCEPGGDCHGLGDRDRGPRQGNRVSDACYHDRVPYV